MADKLVGLADDEIMRQLHERVGLALAGNPLLYNNIQQGQLRLGQHIEDLFIYCFDNILGKRDSHLFEIKLASSPAAAVDRINTIVTSMAFAHEAVTLPTGSKAEPVTPYDHPHVNDFPRRASVAEHKRATEVMHHYRAFVRLNEQKKYAIKKRKPFVLNARQSEILSKRPPTRGGYDQAQLLRVVMPGGRSEVYFLNFQAPPLLFLVRHIFDRLHRNSVRRPGEKSIVVCFFEEQKGLKPKDPQDIVWRILILAMAIMAAALYVAREDIQGFLNGISGRDALDKNAKAAMIFHAKILAVEKVIMDWLASPQSAYEYPLLRHRLLSIMADVIGPVDEFVGYDLIGPPWIVQKADHLAFLSSFTAHDHKSKGKKQSLTTKAPTMLETSYQSSRRSSSDVLRLLGDHARTP
ncbi:hypothetical protein NMY22_g11056 [Coprinellus aureogranulatus]|nr:hypothetical protein NMY22_g11056 [Coprinellus aureogranulatus]